MGRIGNFGKLIVFETSDSRILNFTDYQRTISANWAKHERIGKKPQSEFLNPELMTVQFKVVLNAQHGVKPWKTFHEITKAVQQGRVEQVEDHTGYPVKPCCYGYWGNPEDGCQSFIGRISVGRAAE